jgi:8-oxo-dGTP pyrophosphatase MutT (NUDIX family)
MGERRKAKPRCRRSGLRAGFRPSLIAFRILFVMASRSDLIALLTAYDASDPDEQDYRIRMLDLAAVAHDPFRRTEYDPGHFTASGFVLNPDGDRLLLIHHARLGIWVQPGGHVDPGDPSLLEAARREIVEETGIARLHPVTEGLVDIDIHRFEPSGDQPEHLHFDVRFAFVADRADLRPNAEVLEAVWVRQEDLAGLTVDRSVIRPAAKLL